MIRIGIIGLGWWGKQIVTCRYSEILASKVMQRVLCLAKALGKQRTRKSKRLGFSDRTERAKPSRVLQREAVLTCEWMAIRRTARRPSRTATSLVTGTYQWTTSF